MSDETVPYREGEPAPSPRHIRARIKHDDGPDEEVWILPGSHRGKIRQENVDAFLPIIRWQWRHLGPHMPNYRSFEDYELGFMKDAHPAREIGIWLRATYAFLAFQNAHPGEEAAKVFRSVVSMITGRPDLIQPERIAKEFERLMDGMPSELADPMNYTNDGRYKGGESYLR